MQIYTVFSLANCGLVTPYDVDNRGKQESMLTYQQRRLLAAISGKFYWNIDYINPDVFEMYTSNHISQGAILNKANLRDLKAATGLVILLKLDSNRRFFRPCDLGIWWMTTKNNRAPFLCLFKLFASFRSHWWVQTGVKVWKCLIWVKRGRFF